MKTFKKLLAVVLTLALALSCICVSYATAEDAEYNYYCGFEAYTEQIEGMSLDSTVATIVTDTYYVGEKALKLSLADGGISAFELRDSVPFDIVAGKEYTVTFAYKATADVKFGLGMASAGNVTETAKADVSVDAAASQEWASKTVTFTPDKSAEDAYVMAMLVYSSTANEIYVDDIAITFYSEDKVVLENVDFGFDGSTFPKLNAFVSEDEIANDTTEDIEIWDGTVAESFAGGSGTESDPYQISNGKELALAITKSGTTTQTVTAEDGTEATETVNETYYGSYYILTEDIYLNNPNAIDWKNATGEQSGLNEWYKWDEGVGENFAGNINGDGHTVYGLYSKTGSSIKTNNNANISSALIPRTANSTVTVSNLGVDCAYIFHEYGAGAIVGSCSNATNITNCYVGANVKLEGRDAGALVGNANQKKTTFTNCYSLATYGEKSVRYGLIGYAYHATFTVKNCFAASGPIVSYSNGDYATKYKFYNSYSTADNGSGHPTESVSTNVYTITATNMQGLDVFTHESKMMFLALDTSGAATTTYTATEGYPVLTSFVKSEGNEEETIKIWDGSVATEFAGGTGTASDPYLISDGSQLALAITEGGTGTKEVTIETTDETTGETTATTTTETTYDNYYGKYFKLTNDIYLNNIEAVNWLEGTVNDGFAVNPWYNYTNDFSGTIDGGYNSVYGLYFDPSNPTSYSSNKSRGAGLIPMVSANASVSISNLKIDNSYVNYAYYGGLFVGNARQGAVTIESCAAGANACVSSFSSGVFVSLCTDSPSHSKKKTQITNCYSLATAVANGKCGLIGTAYHTFLYIKYCYNANGSISTYKNTEYNTQLKYYNSYQTVDNGAGGSQSIEQNIYTLTDAEKMQGTDALDDSTKMPYLNMDTSGNNTTTYTATEGYPELTGFVNAALGIEEDALVYWDGKTKTEPVDSDGDGVYEITSGEELAYIIANHGGEGNKYILTNDIYLNDINKINWVTGDVAIGYTANGWYNYNNNFEGSIDGNGYRILGLYYNNGVSAKKWGVYGAGLIPKVLHGDTVNISNLGIDYAYVNSNCGVSAFVGCAGSGNSTTDTPANINITGCYVGANVGLVGYSTGAFQGAASGSLTYITDCYSLATLTGNATGLFAMTQNSSKTHISGCFNANGPISSSQPVASVTNSYQTISGKGLTTVTSLSNMQGTDVLTNADKMPNLNAEVFTAVTQNFSDYDFYIYLPIGTNISGEYELEFYNDLFVKIRNVDVLVDGVMIKGAYVKFGVQPELTDITVPAELSKYVRYGSKAELIASNPYYGVKMDIITDSIAGDDSIKYAFVTDIHYIGGEDVARSVATIKELENLVEYVNGNDEIDFVAIGGDTIQGTQAKSDSLGYYKKAFTPFLSCNKPVFIVPGNHDDNSYAYDTSTFDGSKLITEVDWKNNILDVYINRSTADGDVLDVSVVQDTEDEYSKYFYYDLEDKKTRVICLDANDYEMTCDENGSLTVDADGNVGLAIRDESKAVTNYYRYYMSANYWGYGARQMVWLAEEAMQAGDDWDYVFISHMGIDEATNFNVGAEITWYGKDLRNIIKAYQFKTPYVNEELGIEVDFSATKGEILSYQYGHVHSQKRLYSEDIDLWQMSTITAQYRDGAFDIMNVNDNKIERYVIGRGFDETLIQTKDTVYGDTDLSNVADICDLVMLDNIHNADAALTTAADVDQDGALNETADLAALRSILIS